MHRLAWGGITRKTFIISMHYHKNQTKVVEFLVSPVLLMSSFPHFLQVRERKIGESVRLRLDLVLIYCKSASDNRDKGLFFVTAGGSIELPGGLREIRIKLKDPQQPAGREQQRRKKLAIKQERIGFLHPNENSSCEIDESV